MNATRSKRHPKINGTANGPRSSQIDERLTIYRRTLRRTPCMSKQATGLALRLLTVVARRTESLNAADTILGATTAAALTSLASGMSRPEFCAWLRRTADSLDVPRR